MFLGASTQCSFPLLGHEMMTGNACFSRFLGVVSFPFLRISGWYCFCERASVSKGCMAFRGCCFPL